MSKKKILILLCALLFMIISLFIYDTFIRKEDNSSAFNNTIINNLI